jgi:AbrB family looped-hinge helix DNA binding protein
MLAEARVAYVAELPTVQEMATTKLSAKNQITLPVAMTRYLGLRPGDEIDLTLEEDGVRLRKRRSGKALLDWLEGAIKGVPEWETREQVDAWVREGREWEPTIGLG